MPYENDKNTRSEGKKSVTRKSGSTASGERRPSAPKSQGTKSAVSEASSLRRETKPKTGTASVQSRKTERSAVPQKSRPSGSGTKSNTSRQNTKKTTPTKSSSAKDDYKRFSEDIKTREKSERTAPQKNNQRSSQRSSGEVKKGKSQSRSKLMSVLTYAMIIFAFAALMVTLSLTVFFKTDSINVEINGKAYYTEDKIIEISGIEIGQNIFSIDLEAVESEVESRLPYVEKCEIRRALPTGIRISVISAEPAGVVTLNTGARVIISAEGKSLEKLNPLSDAAVSETDVHEVSGTDMSQTDLPSEGSAYYGDHSVFVDEKALPEIVGLAVFDGTEPGEYIVTADETAITTLGQLTELLIKYDLPPHKIDLSAGNLYAYYDNRIVIKLGSGAELEAKIQLASEIILNKLSEYDSGRVDVSSVNKGYFTPEYMLD